MEFLIKTKIWEIYRWQVVSRACGNVAYYGVDKEMIPYIGEVDKGLKIGMYLPGKHIPIVHEKILFKDKPAYVVMLAWHYGEFIMKRLKAAGLKSDFVIPLPDFRIVKNSKV